MSVLGGATSFALLFESPGLAHVTGDILCMVDLSTFVQMEDVAPFVAKFMASSGIWRRRLLMIEGNKVKYIEKLLKEKAIWRKVIKDEPNEERMHATSRRLCRMLAGYHSEDDWKAKTMRTCFADTTHFLGHRIMPGPHFAVSLSRDGICYAHKNIRGRSTAEDGLWPPPDDANRICISEMSCDVKFKLKPESYSITSKDTSDTELDFYGEDILVDIGVHRQKEVFDIDVDDFFKAPVRFFNLANGDPLGHYCSQYGSVEEAHYKRELGLLLTVEQEYQHLMTNPQLHLHKLNITKNGSGRVLGLELKLLAKAKANSLFLVDQLDFSRHYLSMISDGVKIEVWKVNEEEKSMVNHLEFCLPSSRVDSKFLSRLLFPTQWPHLMIHTRAVATGADRNALAVVDLKDAKGRVQLVPREGRNLGHPEAIREGSDFIILARIAPDKNLKMEFYDTSKLGHDGTGPMAHLRTIEHNLGPFNNFSLSQEDPYFRVEGCQIYLPRQWLKILVIDLWQTEEDTRKEESLEGKVGKNTFGHTLITY